VIVFHPHAQWWVLAIEAICFLILGWLGRCWGPIALGPDKQRRGGRSQVVSDADAWSRLPRSDDVEANPWI
jgi:hypothetical protein